MTQPSLLLYGTASIAAEDAALLKRVLEVRGGWVKRSHLQHNAACCHWPERRFRAAAAASKGQILGGQRGYILTALASVHDVEQAERALLSQARAMTHRAVEIRKVRNSHV